MNRPHSLQASTAPASSLPPASLHPPLPLAALAMQPGVVTATAARQHAANASRAACADADAYALIRSYSDGDARGLAAMQTQQQPTQQQQQTSTLTPQQWTQMQLSTLMQQQQGRPQTGMQSDALSQMQQQSSHAVHPSDPQSSSAALYAQLLGGGSPLQMSTPASPNPYMLQQFLQLHAQMQAQAQLAMMQQQQQQQQQQTAAYDPQTLQLAQQWLSMQQQLALLAQQQAQQAHQQHSHSQHPSYPLSSFGQLPLGSLSPQLSSVAMHAHTHYLSPHLQLTPVIPQSHPTPLVAATFVGGTGSILHVEGLAPTVSGAPQVTADILFTLFGVYGDVMRIKLMPHAPGALLDLPAASASPIPSPRPNPPVVGSALLQFMNRDQASLAMQNLDGVRVLGAVSTPMRVSVSPYGDVLESARLLYQQADGLGIWPLRDYSSHAGHRFKYVSCKNSKHICAPCAALHVSGLSYQVNEQDLRDFFEGILHARATLTGASLQRAGVLERDASSSAGSVHSVVLFGREKKMAFVVCSSLDAALAALVFGHNQKLKGKFIRITFSHAKEHQMAPTHQQQQQHQQHSHQLLQQPYAQDASHNGQLLQQQQQQQLQQPTPHSHPPLRAHPSHPIRAHHDRSKSNDSDLSGASSSSQPSLTSPSTHSVQSVEQQLAAMGINLSAHSSAHSSQIPSPATASRAAN